MVYANLRFASVVVVNRFEDQFMVSNQGRNVVVLAVADRVPAVIPEVIHDQVEVRREQRPERIVEIDCETVAMTQHEPWTGRIPMPSQDGDRVRVQAYLAHRERLGYLPDSLADHVDTGFNSA